MTPQHRRECIGALGLSQGALADLLRRDVTTVRRWFRTGGVAPAEVDAWLERRAATALADPAPLARTANMEV